MSQPAERPSDEERQLERLRAKTTELEAANRELAEYRRLVANVRDYAIFRLDATGHIQSWNAGARQLKGYEPEEIIGRHFSVFYTADDIARDHPAHELEIVKRDGRYEEEGWRVRKDGTTFWASVTITALRDDEGVLTGFAKVTRDLTERKRGEEALERAVEELRFANEELDRFASVAAHDMTDPLRTISGFAELIQHTDLSPEQMREYAGHIHSSSLRLAAMLQGLLTYARAGRSDKPPEPVALAASARRVEADLAGLIAERGATLELDMPDDATVLAAATDVHVVLQNLVSNAVKFGDGARPVVTIGAEHADGGCWRITVADNGAGVDPAQQERIFEAFHRGHAAADRGGYGLGLAICQRLVERYGGSIGVDAEPGAGSRFWFTLPGAGRRAPGPADQPGQTRSRA